MRIVPVSSVNVRPMLLIYFPPADVAVLNIYFHKMIQYYFSEKIVKVTVYLIHLTVYCGITGVRRFFVVRR